MLNAEMQRLKLQNYFSIPNAVFDLDLTDGEILVYAFLLRCEDRRTYQCHPSYATIGRAIGKSVNSVRKYVQGLIQKGLIATERTQIVTKKRRNKKRYASLHHSAHTAGHRQTLREANDTCNDGKQKARNTRKTAKITEII